DETDETNETDETDETDETIEAAELVPAQALPLAELLTRRLGYVFERLAASPATLLHGDLRLDNLFFAPGPEAASGPVPVAVDWSNASRGPGPYDLAYCFSLAFEPEQRRTHELGLLHRYHQALLARGIAGYPFEHCWDDYRLSFLEPFTRMFVLLQGGHAEKGHDRPTEVIRRFVRNAAQAALDLDAGALLAE
ncbi:MAG: phosphotransferase, partial [Chloroflexi bacterium]|nr:phosphotransferase [Chloroflexota bacterium]